MTYAEMCNKILDEIKRMNEAGEIASHKTLGHRIKSIARFTLYRYIQDMIGREEITAEYTKIGGKVFRALYIKGWQK